MRTKLEVREDRKKKEKSGVFLLKKGEKKVLKRRLSGVPSGRDRLQRRSRSCAFLPLLCPRRSVTQREGGLRWSEAEQSMGAGPPLNFSHRRWGWLVSSQLSAALGRPWAGGRRLEMPPRTARESAGARCPSLIPSRRPAVRSEEE